MSSSFSCQCASWKFVTYNFHYIFRYEFFLFLAFLPLLRPLTFLKVSVVQEYQPAVHQIRLFGLSLGPDLPWADEPSPGNLRLSTARILTLLSLLIPAFSLLPRPQLLSVLLHPTAECSSTTTAYLIIHIKQFMKSFVLRCQTSLRKSSKYHRMSPVFLLVFLVILAFDKSSF